MLICVSVSPRCDFGVTEFSAATYETSKFSRAPPPTRVSLKFCQLNKSARRCGSARGKRSGAHLAWADPRLQRCRSCPACSASAPPPRPRTPAMTTARRASGGESGCTAASGSGRSCSCREQQRQHYAAKREGKTFSSSAPHSASEVCRCRHERPRLPRRSERVDLPYLK